jgi:hypothetical protein
LSRADALRLAYFAIETAPAVLGVDASQAQLAGSPALKMKFPGATSAAPSSDSVAVLDWNYDFKNDLAFAGAAGLRLYQQSSPTVSST